MQQADLPVLKELTFPGGRCNSKELLSESKNFCERGWSWGRGVRNARGAEWVAILDRMVQESLMEKDVKKSRDLGQELSRLRKQPVQRS